MKGMQCCDILTGTQLLPGAPVEGAPGLVPSLQAAKLTSRRRTATHCAALGVKSVAPPARRPDRRGARALAQTRRPARQWRTPRGWTAVCRRLAQSFTPALTRGIEAVAVPEGRSALQSAPNTPP